MSGPLGRIFFDSHCMYSMRIFAV